ncbi:hypothetical protein GT347_13810 [Xylophilus rhododendri]|uniref:Uncharacterized protein n=1 Tax=Xylophilus rhododendri TaxID=2697032 RepID=A0A857J874_9BURK|nr:hypothetical protein [Xylophilus rhododendri]QHI98968.1 hypothetical protein GT347_13810 [Xylophilus rhododendri]
MNTQTSLLRQVCVLAAGCMLGLAAHAAVPGGCNANEARNDPAACKRESGAAKLEAKRGNLTSPGAAAGRNAADRCRDLTGGEKTDCLTRMSGGGTSSTTTSAGGASTSSSTSSNASGSVEGGGVIRETTTTTTTTVPAKP